MRLRSTPLAAALVLGSLLASAPAQASPIGDARHRAAVLRAKVDALRIQAEVATEEYDAAYAELGRSVTAHLTAEQAVQDATDATGLTDQVINRRVRALYMSGGTPALYARVLNSATIAEVANRLDQVKVVLTSDRLATRAAGRTLLGKQAAEQKLAVSAAASTTLQSAVAAKGDRVRALLAETDALLASADQQVRALAEEQRLAAEAAAAARAAAALSRAQYTGRDLPAVDASPLAAAALGFAQAQLGKPYVWGATGPGAFDCSGLTGAAYNAAGLHLPRTSREQWFAGPHVALADLAPGDLLFWASDPSNPGSIHHVALYAGNGLMVAAPHSGDVVKVQPVYLDGYIGAVRPGGIVSVA